MRTYETALKGLMPYITKVAGDNCKRSPMFGFDDLMQEFRIAIHRCVAKYPSIPDKEFEKVAVTSVKNVLFTIFRPQYVKEDMKHFRYEGQRAAVVEKGSAYTTNEACSAEVAEDNRYDLEISDLMAELDPADAEIIKELIDPKKKRPMGKRAEKCAELLAVLRLARTG